MAWFRVSWLALALLGLGAHGARAEGSARTVDVAPGDAPAGTGLERGSAPAGFSTHDAGWLHLAYHPSLAARAAVLEREASAAKQQLAEVLGRPVLGDVHVRLARNVDEMATLAPGGARLPEYAAGVAFPELGLVLLTAEPRYPGERLDLAQVFKHELAHVALHDAVAPYEVPRWFNEGFAVHASGEAFASRVQTLWTATLAKTLLPLRDLTRRFPADASTASIAYAQASDIVRFLGRGDDGPRFRALIERTAAGQGFEKALADAYGTDITTLENEWREDVAQRYSFWPILFGSTTLWGGAIALSFWAYVKRKRRAQAKMQRWEREEAVEDLRRVLMASSLGQARGVQLVLAPSLSDRNLGSATEGTRPEDSPGAAERFEEDAARPGSPAPGVRTEVPRVQHDGGWHTLH